MKRLIARILPAFCLVTILCAGRVAFAQSPAASASEAFSPLVPPPAPASAQPASTRPATARSVSPTTAERLAVSAPKYVAPDSPTTKAAASAPDLRETDRPRNTTIRLPDYVVRQSKEVIYKEDQFITPEGKLQRTYDRHRGLRTGSFWIFKNDVAAREIMADDDRVQARAQLSDLLSVLPVGSDPAVEKSVRAQVQSTYIHPTDWVNTGGQLQKSREHP